MKVLLVSHEASLTGAPRVAVDLLGGFEAAGARSTVWHRWGGPLTEQLDQAAGASVRQPLNRTRARLRRLPMMRNVADRIDRWGIRRTIARLKPDLIWCNTSTTVAVAAEACRLGVPTILHIHEESEWARARLASAPHSVRSARLVACSAAAADLLADAFDFGTDDVTVITSAVDVDGLLGADERVATSVDRPIVLGCGTVDRRKGFDVFVRAAERSAAQGRSERWQWIGAPDAAAPTGPVEMLGEQSGAAALIARAHVFVLPSREDPFPLVVLEAMALGRPVVVTDIPGPVTQVGDAGVVVPINDPDALAVAVHDLVDDPERAEALGRRAQERCREQWDIERFRASVAALLGEQRSRPTPVVVLHALTGLAEGGGVQTVVRQLAATAPAGRLSSHVVTTRPAHRSGDLGDLPVTLHPLGYTRAGYRIIDRLRLMLGVARRARRVRPDVVHLHSGIAWLGLGARVVLPRAAFVLEVHDAPGSGRHGQLTDRLEGWWVRYLGAIAVCHSTAVEDDVRRIWKVDDGSVERFPLGVDTELFRPRTDAERRSCRRSLGIAEDAHVVVAVGRLAPSKRFGDAIDVVAANATGSTPVHLVVVGGGVDDPRAAALTDRAAALGVERLVHVIGSHFGDALAEAIGAADVLLSPSEYEGFGLAVVEAMSCGIPVIATKVGGVNDLLVDDETGIFVDVGDTATMAAELRSLLDDRVRCAQMGALARIRALTEFEINRTTDAFLALYDRKTARRWGAGRGGDEKRPMNGERT